MTTTRAFLAGLAGAACVAVGVAVGVALLPTASTARPAYDSQVRAQQALPADGESALARLDASPRHGEWVTIGSGADRTNAWVVYPERADKAPVVVVIHEIFGLTHWIRAVADQLAAEGFIAIAPDLMTSKNLPTGPNGPEQQAATTAIRTLDPATVQRHIDLVAQYGMALPAALPVYGVVGFCWGGTTVFNHAVHAPGLGASVVYYGSSPATETLGTVRAPVLGLYGGSDARVNATIEPAESALQARGQRFEKEMYDGAGHGFLRQQGGNEGANRRATEQAWPRTVAFLRETLVPR
jgi:carboxymethylenebutenolidase